MIKADKESNLPSFCVYWLRRILKLLYLFHFHLQSNFFINSSKDTKCLMRLVISSSLDPPLGMPTMSKEISCILSNFDFIGSLIAIFLKTASKGKAIFYLRKALHLCVLNLHLKPKLSY